MHTHFLYMMKDVVKRNFRDHLKRNEEGINKNKKGDKQYASGFNILVARNRYCSKKARYSQNLIPQGKK